MSRQARAARKRKQNESDLFSIVDIANKGKGAVARRAIPSGNLILTETPLFTLPLYNATLKQMTEQLEKLEEAPRKLFFELHNNYPLFPIAGIYKTNGMPADSDRGEAGIFLTASRFNHACAPNAMYSWIPEAQHLVIYALRDIQAGEEINVIYIGNDGYMLPVKERRQELKEEHNFVCTCKACSLPPTESLASDARKIKVSKLREAVADSAVKFAKPRDAMVALQESKELLRAEGGFKPIESHILNDALEVCVNHGDFARARAFAGLIVENLVSWQGPDRKDVKAYGSFALRPSTHPLAGRSKLWKTNADDALSPSSPDFEAWLWERAH